MSISRNIFSDNRGFQIGYSELFLRNAWSWRKAARDKDIVITRNLIHGDNISPIEGGGAPFDRVKIYSTVGDRSIHGDPLFKDPADQDFVLRRNSPANKANRSAGIRLLDSPRNWWKHDFPPKLAR